MLWLWWTALALAGDPAVEGRDAMHQGNVRAARVALNELDQALGSARRLVPNHEVSGRYQLAAAIADLRVREGDMRTAMRQIWIVAPEGTTDPALFTRSSLVTALAAELPSVMARPEIDLTPLRLPEGNVYVNGLPLGDMPLREGRHLVQVQCADLTWSSAWSWMDRPERWGDACPDGALAAVGASAPLVAAPTPAPTAPAPPTATGELPPLLAVPLPPGGSVPPAETPLAGTPLAEAPPAEAPPAEAPPAEAPPAETPPAEAPPAEAPPAETPPAEAPPAETPPAEAPPAETTPTGVPEPEPASVPEPAGEQTFVETWSDRLWPFPILDPDRVRRFDPPGRALMVGPTVGYATGLELQFVPKGDEGGVFLTAAAGYVPLRLSISELGVGWQPRSSPNIGVEVRGGIGLWHDHILYTDGLLYLSGVVGARYDPPGPGLTAFLGGGRVANYVTGWWVPRANVGWQF